MEDTTIYNEETQTNKTNETSFFRKVAFLLLDKENKENIAQEINNNENFGKIYRVQLILSVIISTLGLLINSVPVIIGAMLISPILLPIKKLAFSLATGHISTYKKGLNMVILSIVVSIITASIITYFTPLAKITPEILARTSPTLIDLFIAIASGIVAFISLGYKRLRENLAGVAMATALIPPLCVTGIGLTFLNIAIAKGSILLFLTNLIAIVLIGVFIFIAFGFFPTNRKGEKYSIGRIIFTLILIIAISIPLTNSMKEINSNIRTNQIIEQTSNDFFKSIDKNIEIETIEYQQIDTEKIRINTTIDVPNTTTITQKNKDELSKILAASTEKSVDLDLKIVNISSVYIEKQEEPSKEEIIQQTIKEKIKEHTGVIIIESKIAFYNDTQLLYLNLFSETPQDEKAIEEEMKNITKINLGEKGITTILWHKNGENEIKNKTGGIIIETNREEEYTNSIKNFLLEKTPNTFLEKMNFIETEDGVKMYIRLSSGLKKEDVESGLKDLSNILENNFKKKFTISASTLFFSDLNIQN